MSAIFPRTAAPARAAAAPTANKELLDTARFKVKQLLQNTQSFNHLPPDKAQALAKGMVDIATYLAAPDDIALKRNQLAPAVRSLADDGQPLPTEDQPEFGSALKTGVQQAGALMQAVNFPSFVSGLIDGVFHSIVTSSIQQMEAYAKLVADVSKSLNQFRDDNTTQNQGRDHLVEQFPDIFQIQMGGGGDWGDFGGFGDEGGGQAAPQPRVALRPDIDEKAAVNRLNQSLPLDKPLTRLDDELVEALLVPAARTQIATGRQQLLATIVMLGINRIVVTDGKISAKVMYDFQSRDNLKYRNSATKFDHAKNELTGEIQKNRSYQGTYEGSREGGSYKRSADGTEERQNANYYSKGDYKYDEQPIIKMMSTSQLQNDASLQARASLAGQVEVNFKSDYMPLDKLANPESIAAIQMNAQPGMVKTMATNRPPAPAAAPAATPTATTPAATPTAPATTP